MMKPMIIALAGILLSALNLFAQQDKIDVFPAVLYDRFIVYQNLIIFWIGIIGLIVIIKMKLREIERTQKMGIDKDEKDIPILD
jgi:hypothetical protein